MTSSILIGALIYKAIMSDETVREKIHYQVPDAKTQKQVDKYAVFPLVAENGTPFPFIVYARTNVYPDAETKDGCIGDKTVFQLTAASDKYFESAELANDLRELFDRCCIYDDTLKMTDVRMTSVSESFSDDTYIQSLTFECSTMPA